MFSVLRMDIYRLFKTKSFWICGAVLAGMVAFIVFSLWLVSTVVIGAGSGIDASFANSPGVVIGIEELNSDDVSEIQTAMTLYNDTNVIDYLGLMAIPGELVGVVIAVFIALFMASEFESGFSKNVFSSLKSRRSFFFSKAIIMLIVVAIYLAVASLISIVGGLIAGFALVPSALGDVVLWAALTILTFWALSMLVSLLAWLSKSKTPALIVGIVVASGIVGGLIASILNVFPDISFLKEFMLYSSSASLGGGIAAMGTSEIIRVACVGGGYLVLYSVLSMLVLRKKDI